MISPPELNLSRYAELVKRIEPLRLEGEVVELVGLIVESRGPLAAIGDFCEVRTRTGRRIRTQVIGFRKGRVLSMPLEETDGLCLGDSIVARGGESEVAVSPGLLGRVLDGFGKPMDKKPLHGNAMAECAEFRSLYAAPAGPLERAHIEERLATGIRVIDGLLPCGKGQRIGIFGGSGVGKSTLLGSMARSSSAGVNVIAMIGERNREVRAFLEHDLGPEGMKRSVVVVATSDRPAPLRVRACFVALAIAEYFRDRGEDVLLVMDSVTRLAMAQREIGLAAGEPPSQKGIRHPSSACSRRSVNVPGTSNAAPSRHFLPSLWKATTLTNRFAMPCAPFWTGTSRSPAISAPPDITRRLTCSIRSADCSPAFRRRNRHRTREKSGKRLPCIASRRTLLTLARTWPAPIPGWTPSFARGMKS